MIRSLINWVMLFRQRRRAAQREYQFRAALVPHVLRRAGYSLREGWSRYGSWKVVEWRGSGSYIVVHVREGFYFNAVDKLCVIDVDAERILGETAITRKIAAWHIFATATEIQLTVHLSLLDAAARPTVSIFQTKPEGTYAA